MAGFAPFGITLFGTSNLWVSYAMQDAAKHDPVHQAGAGYIDIFTTDGVFVERFATGGNLNAPWGMVLTPASFGPLGGNFWIGNFGDGMINTFDTMGNSKGQPMDSKGQPLHRRWTVGAGLRQWHQQCGDDVAVFHGRSEYGDRGNLRQVRRHDQEKILGYGRRNRTLTARCPE